jgi:alpha-1,2-glucosyltransferase
VTLVFFLKIFEFQDLNENNVSRSVSLALTPTIYFFNFLNYTDTASLMLMTMAFYYNLVSSRKRLFLCSVMAVLVRQNNIVWLGYLALYRTILDHKELFSNNKTFISHISGVVKALLSNKTYIIKQFKYQLALLIVFFGYLNKYNHGRLVFGDVDNHTVIFHPTQIVYFGLFACINLPLTLSEFFLAGWTVLKRIYYSRQAMSTFLFLLSASIILVDQYTYENFNSVSYINSSYQTTGTMFSIFIKT